MITLFSLILLTTIWCLGIKIATMDGMVLGKLGAWAESKTEQGCKLLEPMLVCPFCMPSIHSFVGYLFAYATGVLHIEVKTVLMFPLVVCGASIATGCSWILIQLLILKLKYEYQKENIG